MTVLEPKSFLISIFDAAVAAADPERTIRDHLPAKPRGRTIVIGAGKGSAQMAAAFEKVWDGPIEGLVVTRYGYGAKCERIEIIEAAHPVPDAAGLEASRRLLEKVQGLTSDDLVVALISGGGSALLPSPAAGLTLADEIAVNEALLASGAPIAAMNTIRKHVSTIKGGRLAAAAWPAKVVSLVVSDIPGDNPALVASGPTVPDTGSREDALASIAAYGMKLPDAVMEHINSTKADAPSPGDERFAGNEVHLIASAGVSLEAAAAEARRQGIEAVILSDSIEGEAREVGGVHAAIAREVATRNRPFSKPVLILSGVRQRSPCAPRAREAATPNSCSPSPSASAVRTTSMHWPPTPTALTARKTMRAPSPMVRRWRVCVQPPSTPRRCLRGTMPGRRSMRLTIFSCQGRPVPMSTISGPF